MTTAVWFLLIGSLLLIVGLSHTQIKRYPVTPATLYLAVGMIVGPMFLGLFHFNPHEESGLLEVLTEVAVLISLFSAGVKMPVPFSFRKWSIPIRLAFISMALTVGMIALFAHYLLALPLGAAVLLGAIIAPTDPVLATDVQVRHPGDNNNLRFSLTCEAGMNDGSAFPFVMLGLGLLGLHELGEWGSRWIVLDMLWATASGIVLGVLMGWLIAKISYKMRSAENPHSLLNDLVALGLIGAVYGLSLMINAWGFLAVFAAAVMLRQTEMKAPSSEEEHAENRCAEVPQQQTLISRQHNVSQASLVFNEHLERLSEVLLVLLIGGTLFLDSWSWRSIAFAAFVLLVARPASVYLALIRSRCPTHVKHLIGWFGVRGIGSLYYLMYAIQHGIPEPIALELIHLTLIVVTSSIVFHGISIKPMINRYKTDS